MRKPLFTGAGVAIVTPFSENGVNYDKMQELIEFQINEGIDSIISCGTTGEASTMPDREHIEVVEFTVKQVAGRVPVIAGCGSNDTVHAINLSKMAQDVGADGILSVTPYYNKTTQKGLYEHFRLIAEGTDIPIILYNVPSRTNLNIDPDTMAALSQIENITGIKECNLGQVPEAMNLCDPDFSFYTGNDNEILPMMAYGGKGVISVMANIIPKDTRLIATSYLNGDTETSRRQQLKTTDLIKALFIEVNPIPIKAALNLLGYNVGVGRLPLVDISEKNLILLKDAMEKYGLFNR